MTGISGLFKRATSYLGYDHSIPGRQPPLDGEIVFSKNNVCVHPTATLRVKAQHNPGYLTLRYQEAHNEFESPTIFLTWIPNTTIHRNPAISDVHLGGNSPRSAKFKRCLSTPNPKSRSSSSKLVSLKTIDDSVEKREVPEDSEATPENPEITLNSGGASQKPLVRSGSVADLIGSFGGKAPNKQSGNDKSSSKTDGGLSSTTHSKDSTVRNLSTLEVEEDEDSEATTEGADSPGSSAPASPLRYVAAGGYSFSEPPILYASGASPSPIPSDDNENSLATSPLTSPTSSSSTSTSDCGGGRDFLHCNPETVAANRNLNFPDTTVDEVSPVKTTDSSSDGLALVGRMSSTTSKHLSEGQLGIFSVDLALMRSLRLFFSDETRTSGQLIIASLESQYKIFHFHHGGLDKLVETFQEWNLFATATDHGRAVNELSCEMLSIQASSNLPSEECHPEERKYCLVDHETWKTHIGDDGRINDNYELRKAIFFGGLDARLRREVWPFLLRSYDWSWSSSVRQEHRQKRAEDYEEIGRRRKAMTKDEEADFWRSVQCTVEKDVVRTDRSNPYFAGPDNANVQIMKEILLNFAFYCPKMGYNQGMSDLLAPIMVEIGNEADAFWCFVGLMNNTIFVSSPRDNDMEMQLSYLRALLRVLTPDFYAHLDSLGDAMELLFSHRWLLLCFKREFPLAETLAIWECCWSHWKTDYFHLFVCVAIVDVYGGDVVRQRMRADETLFYFSTLAMHMNGTRLLRKARGLLHKFRLLPRIPCTLVGLCQRCTPGQWDSGHVPTVECVVEHADGAVECGYGGGVGNEGNAASDTEETGEKRTRMGEFRKIMNFSSFAKWGEK